MKKNILLFAVLLYVTACTDVEKSFPDQSTEPTHTSIEDFSVSAEMASFTVADGYQVELFASEDIGIVKPTAMRWDEYGRLWILSVPTYPQLKPGEKPGDKLLVLEDRNNDGRPDTSIVFADKLNIPLGFEFGDGGIYLGEQTNLVFLKDTNNDLRADSREIILSGFGTHDLHQTINSFTWSPSGELFFNQGLSIYSRVETIRGVKKANRSAVWRYRPKLKQLDVFFDESMASDNPWGLSFGNWGETFVKANNPDIFYATPGLVENSHKLMLPTIGLTSNKSCGLEIIRSPHFHDSLQNNMLVTGYYNNKVERMKLIKKGAGYTMELMKPLLSSSSKKFRPVEVKMGPDGAIYVLDWFNPVIGHYQASMRDPSRDKSHGRIWKISAKDRPLLSIPKIASQPINVLLDSIGSKNYWTGYQVRRLLAAMPVNTVEPALDEWVNNLNRNDQNYYERIRDALFVYQSLEIVKKPLILSLMHSSNPDARMVAAQAIGRWGERIKDPLSYLSVLINDKNPAVRLNAIVAAGNIPEAQSVVVALSALDHTTDLFIDYALEKAVYGLKEYWSPALQQNKLSINNHHLRWMIAKAPPAWYPSESYRQLIAPLRAPLDANGVALYKYFAAGASAEDIGWIIENSKKLNESALLDALYNMPAKQEISDKVGIKLNEVINGNSSSQIKAAALRVARAWDVKSVQQTAAAVVQNNNQSEIVRREAVNTYASLSGAQSLAMLKDWLAIDDQGKLLRLTCLKNIGIYEPAFAAKELFGMIRQSEGNQEEVKTILLTIANDSTVLNDLAAVIENADLSMEEAQTILRVSKYSRIENNKLRQAATKFAGEEWAKSVREYNPEYLWAMDISAAHTGDPNNGKKVYDRLNCSTCHRIGNNGGDIGPDLSAVGSGLSYKDITTEVLWPNINIKEGYANTIVTLKNGEVIQGIRALENEQLIAIKANRSAVPKNIDKSSVANITDIGSVMPEGLTNHLSHQELVDLIRYLGELRN